MGGGGVGEAPEEGKERRRAVLPWSSSTSRRLFGYFASFFFLSSLKEGRSVGIMIWGSRKIVPPETDSARIIHGGSDPISLLMNLMLDSWGRAAVTIGCSPSARKVVVKAGYNTFPEARSLLKKRKDHL